MRFNVNEQLYGVHFGYNKDLPRGYGFYHTPLLFDNTPPDETNFVSLTVTEHHKVANTWDRENNKKTCDGYILKDQAGNEWVNQFPYAEYGQTSDTADRRFRRRIETSGEIDKLEQADPKVVLECHLLSEVLENIERGIRDLKEVKPTSDEHAMRTVAKLAALQLFKPQLIEAFTAKFPRHIVEIKWEQLIKESDLVWPVAHITNVEAG